MSRDRRMSLRGRRRAPYRIDVVYEAQEQVWAGWNTIATCWDEAQIPKMLAKARSRFPSPFAPDRINPEIRLVRREIRYTLWPEPVSSVLLVGRVNP